MSRQLCVSGLTILLLLPSVSGRLVAEQAATPSAATLTLSIKGSTTYAKPAPVPLRTALLIVTPVWEDIKAVTEVGGREASGQPLFLSELAVVFGNRAMDCTSVFAATPPTTEPDFLILAGKAEAYLPSKGWQIAPLGKLFTEAAADPAKSAKVPVDRFSVDVQNPALKKKLFSKDEVRGKDGQLVLEQAGGNWRADFAVRADELVAEGQIPVTACAVAARKKAAGAPLLGEKRLLQAARSF